MGDNVVLVTGAAGYIGALVVQQLLDKGYRVRAYDKMYYGDEGLRAVRDRVEVVQGDLRQFDPVALDDVFAVIHQAGLSNDPTANFNPRANYSINTVATQVLAEACRQRGIERFTFASSGSLYDAGMTAEDVLKDENTAINPLMPYSLSNFEAERILFHMRDERFKPVSLRHATVYGHSPRMRFDLVVNTFIKDALTKGEITVHNGGEMWRPLIDAADVARAHIACIEAPIERVDGEVFNLVYRNYRILELAHFVVERLKLRGRPAAIRVEYSDRPNRSYRISGEKIADSIGFRPQVSVQQAIDEVLDGVLDKDGKLVVNVLHPRHYNIEWMTLLHEAEMLVQTTGSVY
jgi:nucleoside-diphosphate-sugar epimerase